MDTYELSRKMEIGARLQEKYEHQGWPALPRPDLTPPEGWSLDLISSLNLVHHPQLSPDGEQVAYILNSELYSDLYMVSSRGGFPQRLTTRRPGLRSMYDEMPRWSPDGRWLAYSLADYVQVIPAGGGQPKKVAPFTSGHSGAVWMPDSQHLLVTIMVADWPKIALVDLDGSTVSVLTSGSGQDSAPQPAPDGKRFVYVHCPQQDLNRCEIRSFDLASRKNTTLYSQARIKALWPRWSPDGSRIAFLSQAGGYYEVWLVNPDGSGLRQLTHAGYDLGQLAWAPDGSRLAATLNRGGVFELVAIDARSGEIGSLRSTLGVHAFPAWTPDGKGLVCAFSSPLTPPDIYRLDLENQTWQALTGSHIQPLRACALVEPEPLTYPGYQGLPIPAFLYKPLKPNRAAIVYPHGGPRAQYGYDWDIFNQYLVAKGYTVLAVNYRGGTGYGYDFEHANDYDWGLGDAQDCIAAAAYLKGLDWVDPQRIGIWGGSYGGYMTVCALSRDPEQHFACGVDLYGDADLLTSWAMSERNLGLYSEMQLGHPADRRDVYRNGSPVFDVENIQKPLLILHGLEDSVVPNLASEELVDALKAHHKTFEYKTYPAEGHGFWGRDTFQDVYTRIERFLDWYLLPEIKSISE